MRKLLTLLLALVLAGGGAGYWALHASAGGASAFRTGPVTRGDLLATISASGTVEPEDVVDVGAQVAGMIKEFGYDERTGKPVDYSSPVEPGTVLARIDDRMYKAKVDQSAAQLQAAQAQLESAKAQFTSAQAKLESARANTKVAQATLAQAHSKDWQSSRDWDRARQLVENQALAQVDADTSRTTYETNRADVAVKDAAVDQAKAQEADAAAAVGSAKAAVGNAEAAVATAQAQLNQDQINLGYCTVTAPVKGVVIDRRVTVGQTIQPSFNTPSLFLLAKDLKRMTVWASVNEADVGQVHVGQPVRFTVDAYPNETFTGTVGRVRLNATSTQNVVTYTVEVSTDNTDGKLLPYMTANLQFEVANRKGALLVPNAALRYRPPSQLVAPDARKDYARSLKAKESAAGPASEGTVWVMDGKFVRPVPVRVGLSDGSRTEVLGGQLDEKTPLVVGEAQAGTAADGDNPFAPKLSGGKKQ
jgi:HlyD family secretion protein